MAGTCNARVVGSGERMLIRCDGGPAIARAVRYPPPLELMVDRGVYVLVDVGAPEHWSYEFVPEVR
jgi:hypothetical protein